jgi:hypothetical protein
MPLSHLVRFTPLIGHALNRDQIFILSNRLDSFQGKANLRFWRAMVEGDRSQSRSFDAVVIERAPVKPTKRVRRLEIPAGLLRGLAHHAMC